MRHIGDSNVIDFGGGGQYNGNSFLDASSRTLKQDIRPLGQRLAQQCGDLLQSSRWARQRRERRVDDRHTAVHLAPPGVLWVLDRRRDNTDAATAPHERARASVRS